jgi:3',5'-cyclic AMP phosphodiesterase CpdA
VATIGFEGVEAEREMGVARIVHITDTHVSDPGDLVYGVDPLRVLRDCIDHINRDPFGGDLCVVTGDLVHYATLERYEALKAALADVRMPVRLLLGNSDDRQLFRAAFPDHPSDEFGFVQSATDLGPYRLLFLDTADIDTPGRLCEKRLSWFDNQLSQALGRPVLIFMHHQPFEMHSPHQNEMGLRDREAFLGLIGRHGKVRHVFFGHAHRPISGSWRGISFSSLRGMQMECSLRQDSADPDLFPCARGIYACAVVDDDQIIINDIDLTIEGVRPFPRVDA